MGVFGPDDQAIGADGQPRQPLGKTTAAPGYCDDLETATDKLPGAAIPYRARDRGEWIDR